MFFQVGDRILAVDGNDIRNSSHEMAVKTIKNAGENMKLLVQSLNTGVSEIRLTLVDYNTVYQLQEIDLEFFLHLKLGFC